jgi:hypothetical protein
LRVKAASTRGIPVNHRDVEFHPRAEIRGHFGQGESTIAKTYAKATVRSECRMEETFFDSPSETILAGVRGNSDADDRVAEIRQTSTSGRATISRKRPRIL